MKSHIIDCMFMAHPVFIQLQLGQCPNQSEIDFFWVLEEGVCTATSNVIVYDELAGYYRATAAAEGGKYVVSYYSDSECAGPATSFAPAAPGDACQYDPAMPVLQSLTVFPVAEDGSTAAPTTPTITAHPTVSAAPTTGRPTSTTPKPSAAAPNVAGTAPIQALILVTLAAWAWVG